MKHFDKDLQELVAKGKSQGFLTYDDVNEFLPDEDVSPDRLDNLLINLDEIGIQLVDSPPKPEIRAEVKPAEVAKPAAPATTSAEDLPRP
ncbi:MAG: RNA polymerase sigma factor region1.1 domain-containing protein, partial [Planctomycetota bacterium]|nr:RNA polymerase sigma factor region1.1 domain-containing protein [Planctomycetota bacterium]